MAGAILEPADVLEALKMLTSAERVTTAETDHAEGGGPRLFDDLLLDNILQLQKHLESSDRLQSLRTFLEQETAPSTVGHRWNFVQWNLKLLTTLQEIITQAVQRYEKDIAKTKLKHGPNTVPPMSPDTLTFPEQKLISTSLQFIVGLGICPNLSPGVGLPLESRSEFGKLLQVTELAPDLSHSQKVGRLWQCMQCLLTCIEVPSLGTIILSRHLGDLLAGLCELSYAPLPKLTSTQETGTRFGQGSQPAKDLRQASPASVVDSVREQHPSDSLNLESVRTECRQRLPVLIDRVYQPLLVREIMILQGGPPPSAAQHKSGKPMALARSPVWLRKLCGRILSERLMKPKGVQNVLRGMLDCTGGPTQGSSPDWRKCDAVAKVIASCPKTVPIQDYHRTVCPQILELIRVRDKLIGQQFLRVAVTTMSEMYTQQQELAKEHAIKPLFGVLSGEDGSRAIRDEDLSQCIEDLHQVFVVGLAPQSRLLECLQPLTHTLFNLYCFLQHGVTHYKKLVEEVLLVFLKQQEEDVTLSSLQLFAFGRRQSMNSSAAQFTGSETGCVLVSWDRSAGSTVEDWEVVSHCLVALLKQLERDGLAAEFFLSVLKDLTGIISAEVADQGIKLPPSLSGEGGSAGQDKALVKIQHNLTVLSLLTNMCEELGPSCFKNSAHILQFVQVTLERGVKVIQNTEDMTLSLFETETLGMAMGLLTAVIGGASKMTEADRAKSKEMLPLLRQLSDCHPDPGVRSMASELQVAVATHGKVWSGPAVPETTPAQATERVNEEIKKLVIDSGTSKSKPLVEVLQSEEFAESEDPTKEASVKALSEQLHMDRDTEKKDAKIKSPLEEALEELQHPLVPIKGHGLISLRKLVDSMDAETLAKRDFLLKTFRDHISHEDSYIYLSAIQGLASLGDRFPAEVLPVLLEDYASFDPVGQKVERSSECRMKLGEVLLKVCRTLGDTIPMYREPLLNAVLSGARDADPLVRASSVSNLGEVCKLLHYSLGGVMHEVMSCVSSLLKSDPEVEVRRSAAMFTTLLLRGLGRDTVTVFDAALRGLYRLLKHVSTVDRDEVVLLHVQLALEELDAIMKDYFFPAQTFEKRIRVLDP